MKPCAKCGHRKTSHGDPSHGDLYCRILGCNCSGFSLKDKYRKGIDMLINGIRAAANAAEVVHNGKVIKTIPALKPEETPKPSIRPRSPEEISGAIRLRAERIIERFNVRTSPVSLVESTIDAQRQCELLDEMDAALIALRLRSSIQLKKGQK